jgi:DNA polymerase III subunit epsilon
MKSNKKNKSSFLDNLISKLLKNDILYQDFLNILKEDKNRFFNDPLLQMELLISNGLAIDINKDDDKVFLKTKKTLLKDQIFCFVDIETNGNSIKDSQIIEIGAIKYQNGKIIDEYQSLVYAKNIPEYIQDITQIVPSMLENQPSLKSVLEEFKIFLEDHIFVAHNMNFDYQFISDSFNEYDLGAIYNRSICTIDLSKRTINAKRYGLDYLKDILNIDIKNQHRAYSDALSSLYIFENIIKLLPKDIITSEDLMSFSKSNNKIFN